MVDSHPDRPRDFEVVVLGSGPAGCAAATILARRSHRVAIVSPSRPPAPRLAVSVPPSARRPLEETGFLDAVDAAPFAPNLGNTVCWAEEEPRVEHFDDPGGGFHACRDDLERVLRAPTEASGSTWWSGFSARTPDRTDDGRWRITLDGEDGAKTTLTATLVVDATGRRGLMGRETLRQTDRSTTTLAVGRTFVHPEGWGDDAGRTVVESHPDGWAWSIPIDEHSRCVTAMLDQRSSELSGLDAAEILRSQLARLEQLARSLEGAEADGAAWACPASLYSSRRYTGDGFLLTGDAGAFIDPLSSFGVKKALSSGWLAGVVAHTWLVDPSMASDAGDFFEAREARVYRRYREISAPIFERAADVYGTDFWQSRAASAHSGGAVAPDAAAAHPEDPDALFTEVPEADVRAAFDGIRSREELRAERAATLKEVERPAVEGYRIRRQLHLASDVFPEGLRYVRGVDLLRLVQVAPDHREVPDGWSAYNGIASPVTLPDYLTALSTAFAAGLLEHGS